MARKTISRLLCTAVLTTAMCSAAGASTAVTAELNPNITVQIDGIARTFYNAQGQEVHPIVYQGTTYLPLRSMGELMNKNVNWDSTTSTVTISGARTSGNVSGVPDTTAVQTNVTFYLSPEITVVVDGTTRTFYTGDGKQVSPAVYNGSIYLPIRSVGNLMNKTVAWNEATQTITLGNTVSNGMVTDYDSIRTPAVTPPAIKPSAAPVTKPAAVTLEQAKQTALNHAGKAASEVTFIKAHKDLDNDRWEYEIEFIASSENGYVEYDYEIDAATGKILTYDYDAEDHVPVSSGNAGSNSGSTSVSEASAKKTALARIPGATTANLYEFKRDFDDGRWQYEGKIIYREMAYEFTIDASSGAILEWDVESIYD